MQSATASRSPSELKQAALDHIFIGMNNHAMLGEEGGPLIVENVAMGSTSGMSKGNRYVDCISGMYFRNTGHGRQEIAKAIYDQISDLSANVYASVTPAAVELATRDCGVDSRGPVEDVLLPRRFGSQRVGVEAGSGLSHADG